MAECVIDFCLFEVNNFLHTVNNDNFNILLCGPAENLITCVEKLTALFGTSIQTKLILASAEVGILIDTYFSKSKISIVDWNESDYEETLIRRVQSQSRKPIRVAIDLSSSIRRLVRISKIVAQNSIILLNDEQMMGRVTHKDTYESLYNNGTVIYAYRHFSGNFNIISQETFTETSMLFSDSGSQQTI